MLQEKDPEQLSSMIHLFQKGWGLKRADLYAFLSTRETWRLRLQRKFIEGRAGLEAVL